MNWVVSDLIRLHDAHVIFSSFSEDH